MRITPPVRTTKTQYAINQDHWNSMVKNYLAEQVGTDLVFEDIPDELVRINEHMRVPEKVAV